MTDTAGTGGPGDSGAPGSRREQLARLLRQRVEMGAGDLVVEKGSREALMTAVRALVAAEASGSDSPGSESSRGSGPRPPRAETTPTPSESPEPSRSGTAPSSLRASKPSTPSPQDAPLPVLDTSTMDYDQLREAALGCTRCGLSETRRSVVFADGNPDARLVVVGEAPGANEDKTGVPFVGAAGKLLDLILASVDLSREESVYICNVIKCRPPGNRNPTPDEIRTCAPYLRRQLELVQPDALLAVGTFAAQLLTGRDSALGKLRGEVHSYEGIPLVVTYHPAALLRNSGWVRPTWDDLQLLRGILDGA